MGSRRGAHSASKDAVHQRFSGRRVRHPPRVICYASSRPLWFTVDGDDLTFYERRKETWSELVARKAKQAK